MLVGLFIVELASQIPAIELGVGAESRNLPLKPPAGARNSRAARAGPIKRYEKYAL